MSGNPLITAKLGEPPPPPQPLHNERFKRYKSQLSSTQREPTTVGNISSYQNVNGANKIRPEDSEEIENFCNLVFTPK